VLLAVLAVLAVVGGVLAVRTLLSAPRAQPEAQAAGGTSVGTSWGTLDVHQPEVIGGLPGSALGGMSHGVQNLVSAGKVEMSLAVTLHNRSGHALPVSAGQFRLRSGHGSPTGAAVEALGTSLNAGELRDGGTLEGTVSFVTAADGSDLWLQLADHGAQVLVPVGAAVAPPAAPDVGGSTSPEPHVPGHEH
jgi:hypothetical protein